MPGLGLSLRRGGGAASCASPALSQHHFHLACTVSISISAALAVPGTDSTDTDTPYVTRDGTFPRRDVAVADLGRLVAVHVRASFVGSAAARGFRERHRFGHGGRYRFGSALWTVWVRCAASRSADVPSPGSDALGLNLWGFSDADREGSRRDAPRLAGWKDPALAGGAR